MLEKLPIAQVMNLAIDIGLILQSLAIVGIAWILKRVDKVDRTSVKVETWMEAHERQDDERHEENLRRFDDIFGELRQQRRDR